MKIIDKNNDYYDYLQDYTDTLTFDRRGSFPLTKGILVSHICWVDNRRTKDSDLGFVLLQCGATYWLFLVDVIDYGKGIYSSGWSLRGEREGVNYTMELLTTWKNYNRPRVPIQVSAVDFNQSFDPRMWEIRQYTREYVMDNIDKMQKAIDEGRYFEEKVKLEKRVDFKNTYEYVPLTFPILRPCGIPELIPENDIYQAIDEHFSLEKTESERIEAIGTTNNDKIVMHGFDTKTSFRGKNK